MFRTLTSSLTILALLAHALLGCCWHHRHEHDEHAAVCGADGHAAHAAHNGHSHACCARAVCRDEHDADNAPQCLESQPCAPQHTCTGLACSYVAAKALRVQGPESRGFLSQPNCPMGVDPAMARSRNLNRETITPGPDSSVSRCARLQSWQV